MAHLGTLTLQSPPANETFYTHERKPKIPIFFLLSVSIFLVSSYSDSIHFYKTKYK